MEYFTKHKTLVSDSSVLSGDLSLEWNNTSLTFDTVVNTESDKFISIQNNRGLYGDKVYIQRFTKMKIALKLLE